MTSVRVVARFRPLNQREQSETGGNTCCQFLSDTEVKILGNDPDQPSGERRFTLDRIFSPDAHSKAVYEATALPIIEEVLKGYNGTVFAYGQTGAGKTFTMEGIPTDPDKMGIIPRMVATLFETIDNADEAIEFSIKCSIVEIYKEAIRDLLDPRPPRDNLKVHEDKARGVYLADVTEEFVTCEQDVFDLLHTGHKHRSVAYTAMNATSSRSHLLFMVTVGQQNKHDMSKKAGKLFLVDLAGSEKVGKTGAAGDTLEEAKMINKSLSALGNVINALTDPKIKHVPYRDSKLTRILTESLGGNAKTCLLIACSPSVFNEVETVSTLRFGMRAKSIKNNAKVNQERSVEELKLLLDKAELTIKQQKKYIKALEQVVEELGGELPSGAVIAAQEDEKKSAPKPEAAPAPSGGGGGAAAEPAGGAADAGGGVSPVGAADAAERKSLAVSEGGDLGASSDELLALMDELVDKKEELRLQSEQISELRRQVAKLEGKVSELEKENAKLLADAADMAELSELKEYEEAEKKDNLEKAETQLKSAQTELEILRNGNRQLLDQMARKDEENETLWTKLQTAIEDLQNLATLVGQDAGSLICTEIQEGPKEKGGEKTNQEVDKITSKLNKQLGGRRASDADDRDRLLDEHSKQVANLDSTLEAERAVQQNAMAERLRKRKEARARREKGGAEVGAPALSKEEELIAECEELKKFKLEALEKIEYLSNEVNTVNELMSMEGSTPPEEKALLENQIERLKKDNDDRLSKLADMELLLLEERERAELFKQMKDDQARPLKKKMGEMERTMEALMMQFQKTNADKTTLQAENVKHEKTIERNQQKIKKLEQTVDQAKTKYDKLLMKCDELTTKFENVVKQGVAAATGQRRNNMQKTVRGGGRRGSLLKRGSVDMGAQNHSALALEAAKLAAKDAAES